MWSAWGAQGCGEIIVHHAGNGKNEVDSKRVDSKIFSAAVRVLYLSVMDIVLVLQHELHRCLYRVFAAPVSSSDLIAYGLNSMSWQGIAVWTQSSTLQENHKALTKYSNSDEMKGLITVSWKKAYSTHTQSGHLYEYTGKRHDAWKQTGSEICPRLVEERHDLQIPVMNVLDKRFTLCRWCPGVNEMLWL